MSSKVPASRMRVDTTQRCRHTCIGKDQDRGITAEAIPSPERFCRFLSECWRHDVSFMGRAGLHHAIRAEYPLTYENNPPSGTMFGTSTSFSPPLLSTSGWDESEVTGIPRRARCLALRFR